MDARSQGPQSAPSTTKGSKRGCHTTTSTDASAKTSDSTGNGISTSIDTSVKSAASAGNGANTSTDIGTESDASQVTPEPAPRPLPASTPETPASSRPTWQITAPNGVTISSPPVPCDTAHASGWNNILCGCTAEGPSGIAGSSTIEGKYRHLFDFPSEKRGRCDVNAITILVTSAPLPTSRIRVPPRASLPTDCRSTARARRDGAIKPTPQRQNKNWESCLAAWTL